MPMIPARAFQLMAQWAASDAPPEIRDEGGIVVPSRELAELVTILYATTNVIGLREDVQPRNADASK